MEFRRVLFRSCSTIPSQCGRGSKRRVSRCCGNGHFRAGARPVISATPSRACHSPFMTRATMRKRAASPERKGFTGSEDSLLLKEKGAIVTGASRGIGREIAGEFAREGATVVVASRSEARRVGQEGARTCRSRRSTHAEKKK